MHNPENIQEWKNFRDDLSNKPHIQKRYIKYYIKVYLQKDGNYGRHNCIHFDFMSMIDFQIEDTNELKILDLIRIQ